MTRWQLHDFGDVFFSKEFVEPRPLLQALEQPAGCVLLIDEIDKSDAEFESLLLEILSDFQVTIPELGTVSAITPPTVILTSNSERDLGDALKRRCLHLHIGFPSSGWRSASSRAACPASRRRCDGRWSASSTRSAHST